MEPTLTKQILTFDETLDLVIAETKNQLMKETVMLRLYEEMQITASLDPKTSGTFEMGMRQTKANIERFKKTLDALLKVKIKRESGEIKDYAIQ